MAMGRSDAVQGDLLATWAEMPRSPGHAFYDRLQDLLREAGFDAFVEGVCKPYYAPRMGAASRGVARIRSRSAISCGCRTGRKFPTIPGCRARARVCRTRPTRRCSAGC